MNEVTTTQENILQTLFKLEAENERLHDAFDKIRSEIEDLRFGQPLRKLVVDECLEIIDKYKAESEDKE